MLTDIRKSINAILYERVTSPFYGTLMISWIVWNWKILYITFFISENKFTETKIDFILENCSDLKILILYPIISTVAFLTVMPFVSNGAYWLTLKFNNWKINQKNIVEKKQLLSVEQSIQLREDIRNQEDRFNRILEDKNQEIKNLTIQVDNYKKELNNLYKENRIQSREIANKDDEYKTEYESFKANEKLFNEFKKVNRRALKQLDMFPEGHNIDRKIFDYFLSDDILVKVRSSIYKLTEKGQYFNRQLMKEEFEN